MAAGIALLLFGGWLALEGAFMLSAGQLLIASVFVVAGWWLRKRGVAALRRATELGGRVGLRQWVRFLTIAAAVITIAYIAGYFVLMDRHRPTSPAGAFTRFESSFRWAPNDWVDKALVPYQTPWGSVTTWNILYRPMDNVWFHFYPRSQVETDRLRRLGYYR